MREAYENADTNVVKQKLDKLLIKYRNEHSSLQSESPKYHLTFHDSYDSMPDFAHRSWNNNMYNLDVEILQDLSPDEIFISQNYPDL